MADGAKKTNVTVNYTKLLNTDNIRSSKHVGGLQQCLGRC